MSKETLEGIKLTYSNQMTEYKKNTKKSCKENKTTNANNGNINDINYVFQQVYEPLKDQKIDNYDKINDLSILQTTIATAASENQNQKTYLEEETIFNDDDNDVNEILFPNHKSIETFFKHKSLKKEMLPESKGELTTTVSSIVTDNSIDKKQVTNSVKDTESICSDYKDISKSDYFLNYKKNTSFKQMKEIHNNSRKLRIDYYNKLITTNIWKPTQKEKTCNTIFFFDWDDTLLCTSHLIEISTTNPNHSIMKNMKDNLKILDQNVVNLLKLCMKKGEVFIVTNSSSGWAEYSAEKYLPKTSIILNKIPIISAKRLYSKSYPGSPTEWKIKAMIHVVDNYHINKKLISNIISFGDSIIELQAAEKLKSVFVNAYVKSVKFQEKPVPLVLEKQIFIITNMLDSVLKKYKNCVIKISRKKKE